MENVLQSNLHSHEFISSLNCRHVFFTLFFCRDGHIINVILNRDGHIINIILLFLYRDGQIISVTLNRDEHITNIILLFLYRDGHIINVILNRDGHIVNIILNRDGQSLGRKQKQVLEKRLSSVLRSQYTEEG